MTPSTLAPPTCKTCGEDIPTEDQRPGRQHGRKCRACRNAYQREWRTRNAAAHRESVERYRTSAKGRAVTRARHYAAKYDLTTVEFDRLVAQQENRCCICACEFDGKTRVLCVDHCHNTGRVRGLLCRQCNAAIGQLNDDPSLVRRAIAYLEAA